MQKRQLRCSRIVNKPEERGRGVLGGAGGILGAASQDLRPGGKQWGDSRLRISETLYGLLLLTGKVFG